MTLLCLRIGFANTLIYLHCRSSSHFIGNMGVDVQRGAAGNVANNGGQGLNIHPMFQGSGRKCVPLWHNKDKSENPCVARVKGDRELFPQRAA